MPFQTEYEFTLPKGYIDESGDLHRTGTMRLATAADEILPMKDPRVQQNSAYLSVILLARVITKLGNLQVINTKVIEGLFSSDFAYLEEYYRKINGTGAARINVECPKCQNTFEVEVGSLGEA